jgi:peptide/nickel transport system substrate-binding protein
LFPGLGDIVAIKVGGKLELVITVRKRSTFLLGDLSVPIDRLRSGKEPVGTGPFVMTHASPNEIVMSRFSDYYLGSPHVQQIIWKPYPALRTAWAGMMRGEIDFLYEVGHESVEFVQGESSVNTFVFPRPYVMGVLFNSSRGPVADARIRRALNFAVNRQLILEQMLRNRGSVADTAVRPEHWAYDPNIIGYTYDPARALAILDASGNPPKVSRAVSVNPARVQFTCLLLENLALWERMALLVQKQLFEIGVDMKLESVSTTVFNDRVARGDFDAIFLELSGVSMSRAYNYWHSASPGNAFGYRNPSVDEALDAIRRAPDDDTYRAAVSQLQRSMIANPPAIFLAWSQTARAVSRRFRVPSAPNTDILGSVRSWELAQMQTARR